MKKIAIALVLLSTIAFVACKSETPIDDQATPETTATTIEGFTFTMPTEYTPLTKTESSPVGIYASYEFTNPKTEYSPIPQSINFYSAESIEKGETECKTLENEAGWPCTHLLNTEEYKYQKQVFAENKDYNKETMLENFNGRNYFVSDYKCSGDSCTMRTYSTFIEDTKIEIVIGMWGDETGDLTKDTTAADEIMAKFSIE